MPCARVYIGGGRIFFYFFFYFSPFNLTLARVRSDGRAMTSSSSARRGTAGVTSSVWQTRESRIAYILSFFVFIFFFSITSLYDVIFCFTYTLASAIPYGIATCIMCVILYYIIILCLCKINPKSPASTFIVTVSFSRDIRRSGPWRSHR